MRPEIIDEINTEALHEFELLSKVYRPSFQTRKIADYLKQRIKELNPAVEVYEDKYRANLIDDSHNPLVSSGNLWFELPANEPTLANNETIVLQAHMDMVCAFANKEAEKAMEANGVEFQYHQNGTLTSMNQQTSLGADDGVGLGIILAITKSKTFKHGPIRCIITADEEVGMCGASYLGLTRTGEKGAPIQGVKYLINIDNGFDGEIVASTAGAVVGLFQIPRDPNTKSLDKKLNIFTITVSDLKSGHDGVNITDHASAVRVVADILKDINTTNDFQIIEFTSPDCEFHNVLQAKAIATFATSKSLAEVSRIMDLHQENFKSKYPAEDSAKFDIQQTTLPPDLDVRPFSHEVADKIIKLITTLPYGPMSWKNRATGWVETSGNMGPVNLVLEHKEVDGKPAWVNPSFNIIGHLRSCNNDHIQQTCKDYKKMAKDILGNDDLDYYQLKNVIYGWPGDDDQTIINVAKNAYDERGVKWRTINPHFGLEVSWFKHFNPDVTMVSIGPEIHYVHDYRETLFTETMPNLVAVILECIDKMKSMKK